MKPLYEIYRYNPPQVFSAHIMFAQMTIWNADKLTELYTESVISLNPLEITLCLSPLS